MSASFLSRPEKRNHRRIDSDLHVDVTIDGQQIQATATNISCGGLFIPMHHIPQKDNADVEVTLHLPDSKKPVRVVGEVNRIEGGSLIKRRPAGIAVQFSGLYDENIHEIDRFVKSKLH